MSEIDGVNIPGYRIVSRIMAGGMATVYVAEQLKLGSRRVAIKIFRSRFPHHDKTDNTKARHKRFAQEALIARNLQHPHIVQIFDYGSTDEFQYLVMEYLAHGDLKYQIRTGLEPQRALNILQQIANALALLHQTGVVHRDIKPANILFRDVNHAVLADFGIARSIDQNTQLTNTGFVLGTPSYMSPEQINGGSISAKTDIYALGVVFYEMLTGHLPYRGDSVQSVATQHLMAPVPTLPLEVRKLQPLLNRLMAKKSEDRIANGSELLQSLAQIDSSRGFAVKPPSFLQLHIRKIMAVTALMLCSVAVTWAGISQLPYWLDVAAPSQQHIDVEPVAEMIAAPATSPPAVAQKQIVEPPLLRREEALPHKAAVIVGAARETAPQAKLPTVVAAIPPPKSEALTAPARDAAGIDVLTEKKPGTPQRNAVKEAKAVVSVLKKKAPEKLPILEDATAALSQDAVLEENKNQDEPKKDIVKIREPDTKEVLAEQHATHDVQPSPASLAPAPPIVQSAPPTVQSAPAQPASKQQKPPPVISYF